MSSRVRTWSVCGGTGKPEHVVEVAQQGRADSAACAIFTIKNIPYRTYWLSDIEEFFERYMKQFRAQSIHSYTALCYHYIRPVANDLFPRIRGVRQDVFVEHVRTLKKFFLIMSFTDAMNVACGSDDLDREKVGVLFTFDDGLSDHYNAAVILAEHGISGVFFIPTCILMEQEPINPVIIHYCLAHYGISKFLGVYREALEDKGINFYDFPVFFKKGEGDPMETIGKIKTIFKYHLPPYTAKDVLYFIYQRLFKQDFPDSFEIMHLTRTKIREMVGMGHTIGTHTHSHLSVASTRLNSEEFEKEVVAPKAYLEKEFKTKVVSFSYPFGEVQDCAEAVSRIRETHAYRLAFTLENKLNTGTTPPFELGRHSVHSTDSAEKLVRDLKALTPA